VDFLWQPEESCGRLAAMEESGPADDTPPLEAVGVWPSLAQAREHALVVLAMNLECWIFPAEKHYALLADPARVPDIRREIELYEAEQAQRVEAVEPPVFPAGIELALLWAFSLVVVFRWQMLDPGLADRFCNSSTAVAAGEWWRSFTALFLHADAGHLLSNVALGGVFCVMVAQTVGAWRGWALILAAGTLGNYINAWSHHPQPFLSLGASTATFAALGILTGVATLRAWSQHALRELRPLLVPFITGAMVLAWRGSGSDPGDQTDVAGHVAGWTCGLALGAAFARWHRPRS
jgi:membrane associated rhomboid family serine protease